MKRNLALATIGLLVMAVVGCSGDQAPVAAPPEVSVAEVLVKDVPIYYEIVGQTQGFQDVEIRARVEGYLDSANLPEGAFVHEGDLLYQIDPKPLQAALAQAKADLAASQAQLHQATLTLDRMKRLAEKQAVSEQVLDKAVADQGAASAQADAGRAAVDKAQLDLGYTRVTSPIDGIVGTTEVKAGSLVGAGEATLLTTVSQVDPIVFRGGISEADYLRLSRTREERIASRGEGGLDIELILADGSKFSHEGKLQAIERAVDPTTGTLALQVEFPNPDRLLRPGQYGRLRAVSEIRTDATLVMQRAVQQLQDRYNVAVVGPDNKVNIRSVTVGPRLDDLWVIEEGLQPGERVVVEGLQRLRDGMSVTAVPLEMSRPKAGATEKVEQ